MLINHSHHLVTDAKSFVKSDTLVQRDASDVDSLAVLVAENK